MKKLIIALTAVSFAVAPAMADKCRDPKTGRAAKCNTPGAVPFSAKADADTATAANTKKDNKGRCHWTNTAGKHKAGQIATCPK
jgi:hypothetical protein